MRDLKRKSGLILIAASVVLLGSVSARTAANESIRIMPLGDSITRGYYGSPNNNGYRKPLYLNLTNSGYNIDFVGSQNDGDFEETNHEGHDGWHAAGGAGGGLLPNIYNWLVTNPADIVLLHIGTNDITYGDEDVNEVNDILDEIDSYSEDVIVILALIINRRIYDPMTTQFNNSINDMALNRIVDGDDIIIVDMEEALDYSTDMYDNLHPNDAGYAEMADAWYDTLDSFLRTAIPTITSTPVTNGTAGQLYTYDVDANGYPDPEYTLTTYPEGMTIDPNTGLIEWIPAIAGDFDVSVEASSGWPPDANQSFTITVSAVIKFDAASSYSSGSDGTTLSWPHTIGGGDARILAVGITGEDDSPDDLTINSLTYGTAPMTLVEGSSVMVPDTGHRIKTELYYLLDSNLPSPGSHMVEVTYSGNVSRRCGGAISLENVEQQAAEAVAINSNEYTDAISTSIITQTNGAWVIDVVGCDNDGSFEANTVGMQERFDIESGGSSGAGSTKPTGSAEETMMSWNFNGSSSAIAHSLAAFAPAPRTISGYILRPDSTPIEDVLVSAEPNEASDTTDPNGHYEVLVSCGWSGTVTPTKAEYTFNPPQRTYSNVIADRLGQDYKDITLYDLDDDGFIGWGDVAVMREHLLKTGPDIIGDLNNDEIVDFLDFAEFALAW